MIWLILILLLILAGFVFLKKKSGQPGIFRLRDQVLNGSEKELFTELQIQLSQNFLVLSKVRVEDFIEALDFRSRGFIKSRHIDFLICDRVTTQPLLALELDGDSHNNVKTRLRDKRLNEIYGMVTLPVRHVLVGSNFSAQVTQIKEHLEARQIQGRPSAGDQSD